MNPLEKANLLHSEEGLDYKKTGLSLYTNRNKDIKAKSRYNRCSQKQRSLRILRKPGQDKEVWGSCVRGEQSEESDIDLVVEFEPGKKSFDNYMDLKFLLEALLSRDLDILTVEAVRPAIKDRVWDEAVEVA
jgi:hypothetical protein